MDLCGMNTNWKDSTVNAVMSDVYFHGKHLKTSEKGIELPYSFYLDKESKSREYAKQLNFFVWGNFEYMCVIGYDYNHLIEFLQTFETELSGELIKKTIKIIDYYRTFLKECFPGGEIFDNNFFSVERAREIYKKNHKEYLSLINKIFRSRTYSLEEI